jgi:hypothetical protein
MLSARAAEKPLLRFGTTATSGAWATRDRVRVVI